MRDNVTHIAVLALMNSCNLPFSVCQSSLPQGLHSVMDVTDFAFVFLFFPFKNVFFFSLSKNPYLSYLKSSGSTASSSGAVSTVLTYKNTT